MGRHFRTAHKLKRAAADILVIYAATFGVRLVREDYLPRRRVTITVRGWNSGSLPDPTNLSKLVLDGMKRALLIVDDSAEWLEHPTPTVERATKGETPVTLIAIEDIE